MWMLTNLVADKSFLQVFLVPGKVLFELFVVLRVEAALLQDLDVKFLHEP